MDVMGMDVMGMDVMGMALSAITIVAARPALGTARLITASPLCPMHKTAGGGPNGSSHETG